MAGCQRIDRRATRRSAAAYFMFNVAPLMLHTKTRSPSPTFCPNLPTVPLSVLLTLDIKGTEYSTTPHPRCLQ